MTTWQQITEFVRQMPAGVWVALIVGNLVLTMATWKIAGRRMRRAGQRTADPHLVGGRSRAKDTALTVASMIPAALFWAMVLAGSFHGLVAFGRDIIGWHDGWEYLVPGTLDGVSVTFAFLAFRAVRKQKAPDRCHRVVWGAALASATVNFAYEYGHSGHNLIAGGYLALLSLFGMVMFHEFLDQFEEGADVVRRANPRFGMRWITWPTNTFCAAIAWRNHPPADGSPATVREAVANLDRVRALKRSHRQAAADAHHQRVLEMAHRDAELATAHANGTRPTQADAAWPTQTNGHAGADANPPGPVPSSRPTRPAPAPRTRPPRKPAPRLGEVRVPATADTLLQWATTWTRMCADPTFAAGPINDDGIARHRYGLSAKQLRNIRNAATAGALRRQAATLQVQLPADYVDTPEHRPINGHELTQVVGL